jgi:hypothetical protein
MPKRVTGLRGLFVGNEQSLSERMRLRRWSLVTQLVPRLQTLSVLDLGGTALFWARAPVRPRDVTVINLHEPGDCAPGVTAIRGDALNATRLMAGRHFDLVFSNSLIEHLQGHAARLQFAEVVASMSSSYIVQTPYRYFPVEPHWIFPGFQFLPMGVRSSIAPRWPLGHTRGWDERSAADEVMSTELLSVCELRFYFPDADIAYERVLGIPKSLYAVKMSSP